MAGAEAGRPPQVVTTVLSTLELLEAILLRLDPRTLLTSAQLVSRRWREFVVNSPALQRALFFRPAEDPDQTSEENPLLAAAFPPFFNFTPGGVSHVIRKASFYKLPMAARLDVFTREEASWRRMLVLQPPATKVGAWKHSHGQRDGHSIKVKDHPEGLTMGQLYDVVQEWAAHDVSSARIIMTSHMTEPLKHLGGRRPNSQIKEQVKELLEQSDIVVQLAMTVQCCGDRNLGDFSKFHTEQSNQSRE